MTIFHSEKLTHMAQVLDSEGAGGSSGACLFPASCTCPSPCPRSLASVADSGVGSELGRLRCQPAKGPPVSQRGCRMDAAIPTHLDRFAKVGSTRSYLFIYLFCLSQRLRFYLRGKVTERKVVEREESSLHVPVHFPNGCAG